MDEGTATRIVRELRAGANISVAMSSSVLVALALHRTTELHSTTVPTEATRFEVGGWSMEGGLTREGGGLMQIVEIEIFDKTQNESQ